MTCGRPVDGYVCNEAFAFFPPEKPPKCEFCVLGKQVRSSVPKQREEGSRATRTLEKVWAIANVEDTESVQRHCVGVALRLVGHAQGGREVREEMVNEGEWCFGYSFVRARDREWRA